MKTTIVLWAVLFFILGNSAGNLAQANTIETVFSPECPLSKALRSEILRQLKNKCPNGISDYGLHEQQSIIEYRSLERGHALDYFRTVISSRYYPYDQEAEVQTIVIESREITALNHPAALEILSIDGDCKDSGQKKGPFDPSNRPLEKTE